MREQVVLLPLATVLPLPIMAGRTNLAEKTGDVFRLTFLNESREFVLPFEWHPPELEFGTRLWKLNLHYMEFLEGLDDESFMSVVADWISQNPPYRPGYWLDNWNSYALSIRCVVWMQAYAVRRQQFPDWFHETFLTSLASQLKFLDHNLELDIGGNHLIKNIKALLWAGRFFDSGESRQWRQKGERLLRKELQEQILEDGMHYERSPAYHCQVFVDLVECYTVLGEGGLKDELGSSLEKMATALADTTHPDLLPSLFNDGGLHMAYAPVECLHAWHEVSDQAVQRRDIFAFDKAGYYGLHLKDSYILVDAGKIGPDFLPAHGHGDVFSFEWTITGLRLIIDAGVYEYNSGSRRDYSRSTRAHNTVTLDGLDQCEFWGAFRVARRAQVTLQNYSTGQDGFSITAQHDGYRRLSGKPIHCRELSVRADVIEVNDQVIGGNNQRAEARLLLHPECQIEEIDKRIHIRRGDISLILSTDCPCQLEKAWWYPDFGCEMACRQVVIHYGKAPCAGKFTLRRYDINRTSAMMAPDSHGL